MALVHFNFLIISTFLLLVATTYSAADGGPYGYLNPNVKEKPKLKNEKLLSTLIGVQGLVYCESAGSKRIPLEGAVIRIACLAKDEFGYELAPFSFLSGATDANGYFLATLSPHEVQVYNGMNIEECKAFLELSPLETCKIPTNANQGIDGALLSSYHYLRDKRMRLYTVGPFLYSSAHNSNY